MKTLLSETNFAKPFLKWAGGKSQLIPAIHSALPSDFKLQNNLTYIEPFIGSGAILFWILQKFPAIKRAVISDINSDLTNAYIFIKEKPLILIKALQKIEKLYFKLTAEEDKKQFFLVKRSEFNTRKLNTLESTVLLIFLNRTCFNGLYRVNSKNHFNVPFGKYEKPKICDGNNLMLISKVLQKVTILNGDYQDTIQYVTDNTFFYLDPPYRPLSKTSSFNAYAKHVFDDNQQIRLKEFCDKLTDKNYKWMLSNSDPKNVNINDNFFDELYSGDSIFIDRVKAKRMINSNSNKRGNINELLITNYAQCINTVIS